MPPVSYTAPVVCPMSGPPLADGAVIVEGGTIVALAAAASLRGQTARTHHVDGVLLPGLVNASTRFELADARAGSGPAEVGGWDDDRWRRSAHRGVQEALRAGVTAAGDIVARGAGVPPACRGGLAGDSFVEVPAGADPGAVVAALERALDQPAPGRRVGIATPAPRGPGGSDPALLAALADLSARRGAPLRVRGDVAVSALADCGALLPGTSIEPVRPLDSSELGVLAEHRVAVVARPRSAAEPAAGLSAGDTIERCLDAGVVVALGSGDLQDPDVLAEAAAWLRRRGRPGTADLPDAEVSVPAAELAVRLATAAGAAALGWEGAGVLDAGRRADLVGVAVATTPARVYTDLLEHGPGRQLLTVVGGVRKARRARADEPWPPVDRSER